MDLGNNIKRNAKYSMGQVLGFAPVNGFVCALLNQKYLKRKLTGGNENHFSPAPILNPFFTQDRLPQQEKLGATSSLAQLQQPPLWTKMRFRHFPWGVLVYPKVELTEQQMAVTNYCCAATLYYLNEQFTNTDGFDVSDLIYLMLMCISIQQNPIGSDKITSLSADIGSKLPTSQLLLKQTRFLENPG
ncbi:hypothetical protein M9H77_15683 [Catharanthus roseus]|uniref:Uncharacterized protein n=1 Tax=Catharanthus roseus TaxID=4058 RepID=A0ACC0AY86_CATRO|nr:hypothetical protein M9H77_15683 [Catharanthus roseus]